MSCEIISNEIARRFLLGLQGLWPGRRWSGIEGASEALHALEAVQVDPMTVVSRSHDLVLWARVTGYSPRDLDELLYSRRAFFDYGGCVHIYPMEELPCWRVHMERRKHDKREAAFFSEHGALTRDVRELIREGGPVGSRDLEGTARVSSYRARKDSGLALYNLWLTGDLMTHGRDGFQRIYGLRERIAPVTLQHDAPVEDAENYFARKAFRLLGLHTARAWANTFAFLVHRSVDKVEARSRIEALVADGEIAAVEIEGQPEKYYYVASREPCLQALVATEIPQEWDPVETTAEEEVVFLSPLDPLLGRQRVLDLFAFEYLWEVYKPVVKRRWGYYTMPILWKDRLVGRLDPKLDRGRNALLINGFWLEDGAISADRSFVAALARGVTAFARFHGAAHVDISSLQPQSVRDWLGYAVGKAQQF
ncbi:MAG: winged helix-turn-helix domain-containing protein [Chloroflexota bacterium]